MRGDRVAEEDARKLWQRAAELQRIAEDGQESEPTGMALVGEDAATVPMRHVLEAAEEAGISGEHVLLALAERSLADRDEIRPDHWSARWLRTLVPESDAIEGEELRR